MTKSQSKKLKKIIDYMDLKPIYIHKDYNLRVQFKKDNKYLIFIVGHNGALSGETWNGYKKYNFKQIDQYCWNYKDILCEIKKEAII